MRLHGPAGSGEGSLLGGGAWQHLPSNRSIGKGSPPMDGKGELTDRLWARPGLADITPGYKRQGSHFVGEHVAAGDALPELCLFPCSVLECICKGLL